MNKHLLSGIQLLFVLVLSCTTGFAQLTMTAEVRPRTEFRNGFKTPRATGQDAALFTEQRSRLYLDVKKEKFQVKLAFQDVRMWGETAQIFKQENGNTMLSEAWGQYFFTPKVSIKAGRQIISYDNQRFLGGLEWAQQGRRHDALLFIFDDKESKTKLHFGLAANSDDDVAEPGLLQTTGANFYTVGGNYKAMQYGWFNKKFENTSLSLLALNATLQNADSTVSNKQTFGLVASQQFGPVKLAGDFYYQTGKLGGSDVNAFLGGINAVSYTHLTLPTIYSV